MQLTVDTSKLKISLGTNTHAVSIVHSFRLIARSWLKIVDFYLPHLQFSLSLEATIQTLPYVLAERRLAS